MSLRGVLKLGSLLILGIPLFSQSTAVALLEAGKADEGLKVLAARIQKNSNDAEAHNLICRIYFQLEQWDNAVGACENSVAVAPDNSEYHQWLGRVYGEKADTVGKLHPISAISLVRKVKAEFERAVALDSSGRNLSTRADLAEFYTEAPSIMGGDKTKARSLADFVMKHDPALAHYMIGRIEEKQNGKDKNRAEPEYKAAIEAAGKMAARYWVSLASFYRRAKRLDDMESAINKSLTASRENPIPLFDAASLLLETGRNYPLATQMLRRYLSSDDPVEDGPSFQAHYFLGQLLEKQGDRDGALAEYRASLSLASQFQPAQDALARLSR